MSKRIDQATLSAIQNHFHALILKRAAEFSVKSDFKLPELRPLLESGKESGWFSVLGMYGGFSYRFVFDGLSTKLMTESWCRISDGSAQRHEITAHGVVLIDFGWDNTVFLATLGPASK